MSITVTTSKTENSKVKDKEQKLKEVAKSGDLDQVLKDVRKIDNTCSYTKCKKKTSDFSIRCKHCANQFCTAHGLPEIHGCGEAAKRDERRKFLHPEPKLSDDKRSQAATKLHMQLKQMQQQRKAKLGKK